MARMLQRLARHVRAHVVGYVALFVALGGTSVATESAVGRTAIPYFGRDLLRGPSVTVEVPPSGLVEIYAQARLASSSGGLSAIATVMDDAEFESYGHTSIPLPECGATLPLRGILATASTSWVTVYTGGDGCGRTHNPGTILHRTTPGLHTFTLYFATSVGSVGTISAADRVLAVAPRP